MSTVPSAVAPRLAGSLSTGSGSSTRKISTETNYTTSVSSSLPTSSAPQESSVLDEDVGGALRNVVSSQLAQTDELDKQLRCIDQFESRQFLDEMRDIQRTGAKAAQIMLKPRVTMIVF